MFDQKYSLIKSQSHLPRKTEIDHLNQLGLKSIFYSEQALAQSKMSGKDPSLLSLGLSMARIYSKLYDKDPIKQIEYLEESIIWYRRIGEENGGSDQTI